MAGRVLANLLSLRQATNSDGLPHMQLWRLGNLLYLRQATKGDGLPHFMRLRFVFELYDRL